MTPYHDPQLIETYCKLTNHLDGDLAEVGVYRGASALCILTHAPTGTLYLYDTFCGMPSAMTGSMDRHEPGAFKDTSVDVVRKLLVGQLDRVVFRAGVFPETAVDEGPFRFVHCDCDQYMSIRATLDWFAPRLTIGGAILIDDYLCGSTPGARRAVDEFLRDHGEVFEVTKIAHRGVLRHVALEVPT